MSRPFTIRPLLPGERFPRLVTGYEPIQILCAKCDRYARLTHMVFGTDLDRGVMVCRTCAERLLASPHFTTTTKDET